MDRTMSIVLYKQGSRKARMLCYEDAFEDYVDAFLPRISGVEPTLEFVSFYRYQLAQYLRAKPVFTLSLPEGDMISDLIADAYKSFLDAVDSSPFNITGEGRKNLLESVKIVFPWHNDTEGLPENI